MRVEKIESRSRNDFHAIYVCEHCGETHRHYGYDDANFWQNVIPAMHCPSCGRNRAGEPLRRGGDDD